MLFESSLNPSEVLDPFQITLNYPIGNQIKGDFKSVWEHVKSFSLLRTPNTANSDDRILSCNWIMKISQDTANFQI